MALEHETDTPLAMAVRHAGSQSAFGRLIGKRQSVIYGWLAQCRPLPAEFVLAVEAATGISRHVLRPDLYPRDDTPATDRAPDRLEGVRP